MLVVRLNAVKVESVPLNFNVFATGFNLDPLELLAIGEHPGYQSAVGTVEFGEGTSTAHMQRPRPIATMAAFWLATFSSR